MCVCVCVCMPSSGDSENIMTYLVVFVFLRGGRNISLKHSTFS